MQLRFGLIAATLIACLSPLPAHAASPKVRCERPLSSPNPRLDSGLTAAPSDPIAYFRRRTRAVALRGEGKLREALPVAEALVREYPCDAYIWRLLGDTYVATDRPADAAIAYEQAMHIGGPGTPAGAGYRLASAYAAAGQREEALRVLEYLVFEERYLLRPGLYDVPAFAPLRNDPRFLRIVGRQDSSRWGRNEGWGRDLAFLVAELRRTNPVYGSRPLPAEFIRLQDALQRDIPSLSDAQIYVRLARLLASLDQGHTNMPFAPSERMSFSQLPIHLYAFPDGLYVVDAEGDAQDLIGSRLITIEKTPALEALRRAGELGIQESGMEVVWTGPWLVGIAEILNGLEIAPRLDRIELTFQPPSGEAIRRTLATVPLQNRPKLVPPASVAPPLFLRNVAKPYWSERIGGDILYVQLNQIQPDPNQSLAEFGLALRRQLGERPVRNVIVDLRHNNGGNAFLYPELLRTLIAFSADERNRLYVVVGRWVYSAGALFATDLQRLAHPIFVGEPTSQTGNQFGDSANVILPYSGLRVNLTGVKWQLSDPWDRRLVIVPHIPVQLTAHDYFDGRDSALEKIQALVAAGSVPAGEMDPR